MNNNKITSLSLLNYFYLSLMILWHALQKSIMTFDAGGRTIFFSTLLVLFVNLRSRQFQKIAFGLPSRIWLIWVIYTAFNVYIQGYNVKNLLFSFFIILHLFAPYVVMVVSAFEFVKDKEKLLKVLLYSFLAYSIIGFFFMDNFYVAMQEGRDAGKTLGNLLAINTVFIVSCSALLYKFKVFSQKKMYMFIVFAVAIIVVSATRKAFGAVIIIYISLIISQTKLNFHNIIKIVAISTILYVGFDYMMENTFMGERFINEAEKEHYTGNNPFLKLVGDRASNYIIGYKIFQDNPIFGIGIGNYRSYTNTSLVLHTEYMVQLCENGIVGFALFAMFYISIIYKLYKIKNNPILKSGKTIMIGTITAILFMGLTAWIYDFHFYFAVIGVAIGYIYYSRINTKRIE